MSGFRPTFEYHQTNFVAAVAAATATQQDPIFIAPCACKVTAVSVVPQAASTGDNTNTKNLNIVNKGASGAGTTEVGNLDLVSGTDLVAFDEKAIPLNATYTNGVSLSEGDVLSLQTEKFGTGVAVGPFIVSIDYVPV